MMDQPVPQKTSLKKRILSIFLAFAGIFLLVILGILGWFILLINTQNLWGYVDKKGHFVVPPQYAVVNEFKNGKAHVIFRSYHGSSCYRSIEYFINKKGQAVSDLEYSEGVNCIDLGTPKGNPSEYLEYADKDIEPLEYYLPDYEYSHLASDRKVGYVKSSSEKETVDSQNVQPLTEPKWIIPPKFDKAYPFVDGVAWVALHKNNTDYWTNDWGLINKKGQYILPPKCSGAGDFHDGLAPCRVAVYFGVFY